MDQLNISASGSIESRVRALIIEVLQKRQQPSARELLQKIEDELGLEARWGLTSVIVCLIADNELSRAGRNYLQSMVEDGSLEKALRGEGAPDREIVSTIDMLINQSKRYQTSEAFKQMIQFMGLFRDYAPYNNMLVHLQNPSCGFFATQKDWQKRFGRSLKEDAKPMLILAPMHPVMLVYDLDQTEGKPLPDELTAFASFRGKWDPDLLAHAVENAKRHRIRVAFKHLSTTHGGFATFSRESGDWKMRIVVHDDLDGPSRFGVLCHELAHILLGHLGSDEDHWWSARSNLDHSTVEIEAEAVAYIATSRLGLVGSSAAYVSGHLQNNAFPAGVSLDLIAKVSGKVERMARELLPVPRPRSRKTQRQAYGAVGGSGQANGSIPQGKGSPEGLF